jgi:hypothetical protein
MKKTIPFLFLLCCILLSCSKENNTEVTEDQNYQSSEMPAPNEVNLQGINRIVILGNSITQHFEYRSLGWYKNCGMAASCTEKDFVHLLIAKAQQVNPQVQVKYGRIGDFEPNFPNYDINLFKDYIDFKPDLIIIRMGENVDDEKAVTMGLRNHIVRLVEDLRKDKDVVICVTNSFWPNRYINQEILESCKMGKYIFVDIADLYNDRSNTADGLYRNAAVAAHPSDKGMKNIADRIWYYIASTSYPVPAEQKITAVSSR